MKVKTFSLSGFGGGYEDMCQKMLWQGVKFLTENNPKDITSKQAKNIYGLCINDGKDGEAFDKAMMEGCDGCTGAMHQCATNHAFYIYKNGYKKWFDELAQHREEGSFEYEFDKEFSLT